MPQSHASLFKIPAFYYDLLGVAGAACAVSFVARDTKDEYRDLNIALIFKKMFRSTRDDEYAFDFEGLSDMGMIGR